MTIISQELLFEWSDYENSDDLNRLDLMRVLERFEGFGEKLGIYGKALSGFAVKPGTHPEDRRGDHDANLR